MSNECKKVGVLCRNYEVATTQIALGSDVPYRTSHSSRAAWRFRLMFVLVYGWFLCVNVHGTEHLNCFDSLVSFLAVLCTNVVICSATPMLWCLGWRSDKLYGSKRCWCFRVIASRVMPSLQLDHRPFFCSVLRFGDMMSGLPLGLGVIFYTPLTSVRAV